MNKIAVALCVFASVAHADELGTLHVEVTGNSKAQVAFRRGLLELHSFWYEQARDDFHEAARLDPTMAIARWGAAQSWVNPVWSNENLAGCREELGKIDARATLNAVEKVLVESTRALCGDGERAVRWRRNAEIVHAAHAQLPNEEELIAFESLAQLGYGVEERSVHTRMQAGALALELFARNPNHPGAAHYIIHAFDDPDHAVLALPAARRYAQIAPSAFHARHMPSHIFVQLGMWEEAAASNEASWTASVEQATKHGRDTSYYDFHSLEWLVNIRLELGQVKKAEEALKRGDDAFARSKDPARMPFLLGTIASSYLIQTHDGAHAEALLAPFLAVDAAMRKSIAEDKGPACAGHREAAATRLSHDAAFLRARALAGVALEQRDTKKARQLTDEARAVLAKMEKKDAADFDDELRRLDASIAELEGKGTLERALKELLAKAKPSDLLARGPAGAETVREQLGRYLLDQNRAPEALALYREELAQRPRRSLSLLGAARAATAAKDAAAKSYWRALADLWKNADDAEVVREARSNAR